MKKQADIGIVFSVNAEGRVLIRSLTDRTIDRGMFHEGNLAGRHVAMAVSGIGKTNASHAVTRLVHEYSPSVIMNIGIGGAYPLSGLKIGDIAIAEKEIYGDEGVLLKDGFHGIDLIGIPLVKKGRKDYYNEFSLDRKLAIQAVKAAQLIAHYSSLVTVKKGAFLTLSTCTGTNKRALELERRFGALCENMEGAAIAHVCRLYDVPMIELRGISNIAGERDRSKWDVTLAAENCQKATLEFIAAI